MRTLLLALALFALAPQARAEDPECLAAFTSRYIGETERNLNRTFAVSSHRDIVLQFDEADALFGRRTNVHDAHDRYANQEVSYLLARIERYGGIQPLASNMRRTSIAGFNRRERYAGIVLIETETGVRAIEFSRADRRRALAFAQETLSACP